MVKTILQTLREFVEGNPSVRKVADDIGLTSELILLVRMMMADGELRPEELANFKAICQGAFGIPEEDVPEVMRFLKDYGYETSAADAMAMFADMAPERKRSLLVNMLKIAKSDNDLDVVEAELIRKTALALGMNAEEFRKVREAMLAG